MTTKKVNKSNVIELIPATRGKEAKMTNPAWLQAVKALNPLGVVRETIKDILSYKEEIRRIEAERERIQAQKELADKWLDHRQEARLAALEHRRQILERELDLAAQTLAASSVERAAVAQAMNQAMLNLATITDPLQIQAHQDLVKVLSECLVEQGRQGNRALNRTLKHSERMLPQAGGQLPPGLEPLLLEAGEADE